MPEDLMPEGERRVESSPIPICRRWMTTEVEELIAKGSWSGGHKAVAITDHGNAEFPHGLKQLSKKLNPADLWMEANIEDKVPITHNEVDWTSMQRSLT